MCGSLLIHFFLRGTLTCGIVGDEVEADGPLSGDPAGKRGPLRVCQTIAVNQMELEGHTRR